MASPDSFRKDFTHLPILLFQRNEGMAKRRGSTRIFCKPNALVSSLRVKGRGQAHNVEVLIGDLFATRNPLKKYFPLYRNIRAITSKLCVHSRPALIQYNWP
jgi:hypothetical protein